MYLYVQIHVYANKIRDTYIWGIHTPIVEPCFHPWKFCRIDVWHTLEILRSKTKTHGNSTSSFWTPQWKFHFFFREHQQKTFATLSGFWSLRGWGASANLLKRKICVENIFSDIFDWSSKNFWKMITADVKANKIC